MLLTYCELTLTRDGATAAILIFPGRTWAGTDPRIVAYAWSLHTGDVVPAVVVAIVDGVE